jgi:hypothetical protein
LTEDQLSATASVHSDDCHIRIEASTLITVHVHVHAVTAAANMPYSGCRRDAHAPAADEQILRDGTDCDPKSQR